VSSFELVYLFFALPMLQALTFGFSLFFFIFLPHLNLSPITIKKNKTFNSCVACNILVMEMRLKSKLIGRIYSLTEFEKFKYMSPKHMNVGVYINERTYHFGME